MKRHLIWIIAGGATLGLTVPAFAAMQSTPDDNRVPNELRGNCDEAEHANEPGCLTVTVPNPTGSPTPITIDIPIPPTTTVTTTSSASEASNTPGAPTTSVDDGARGGTVPSTSVPGDISGPCDEAEHANDPRCTGGAAGVGNDSAAVQPVGTVPDNSVATSLPGDISGPCDEAEHANDPRCTGDSTDDRSGHDADDDSSRHGGDDSSRHGGDDSSRHGGDDSSRHGGDDSSRHGGDDSSRHGGDD